MMLTQLRREWLSAREGQFTAAEARAFRQEAHALIERLSQYADINPTWESTKLLQLSQRAVLLVRLRAPAPRRAPHQRGKRSRQSGQTIFR
jgi:hypothetical protein